MSVSRLPSGKWRAQVHNPKTGRNISVSKVLGGPGTFDTKREAKAARELARAMLGVRSDLITVENWRERWLTDPVLTDGRGESTLKHHRERTKAFAEKHGTMPVAAITDKTVAFWIAGGQNIGTVDSLRTMFSDATKAKAGRIITINPFAGLGVTKKKRAAHPPTQQQHLELIATARALAPASFADYLEFASVTGIRPGEIDAVQADWIDWGKHELVVRAQWHPKLAKFMPPKYGEYTIGLCDQAEEILRRAIDRDHGRYVFVTSRGHHYSPSTRTHHWDRVRCTVGLPKTKLYVATKHYFGWYALNVLDMEPAVIAEQFGHRDGGILVESTYGHPDKRRRREKLRRAMNDGARVSQLRPATSEETGT